jgi:hypothetical protein
LKPLALGFEVLKTGDIETETAKALQFFGRFRQMAAEKNRV